MKVTDELKKTIRQQAEALFRAPDHWPSMERRDLPGSPRNLMFVPLPNDNPENLIRQMQDSFCAAVARIIESL